MDIAYILTWKQASAQGNGNSEDLNQPRQFPSLLSHPAASYPITSRTLVNPVSHGALTDALQLFISLSLRVIRYIFIYRDDDDSRDFSKGLSQQYVEQASSTFAEMDEALYVPALSFHSLGSLNRNSHILWTWSAFIHLLMISSSSSFASTSNLRTLRCFACCWTGTVQCRYYLPNAWHPPQIILPHSPSPNFNEHVNDGITDERSKTPTRNVVGLILCHIPRRDVTSRRVNPAFSQHCFSHLPELPKYANHKTTEKQKILIDYQN